MRTIFALSLLWGGLLGCGDDGGGGVSTGLARGERLSDLEPDEVVMACETFASTFDDAVSAQIDEFNCTIAALPMSISVTLSGEVMGDVGMCRELVSQCLDGEDIGGATTPPVMNIGDQIDCNAPEAQTSVGSCDATVGAFEDCANGLVAEFDRALSSISCSDLSDVEALQAMGEQPQPVFNQPADCQSLETQCPGIGIANIGQ
jgi:hypothetical protein